jgi:S-DNA-T family DNA segregation ATPase FtsK/SpoIIIE
MIDPKMVEFAHYNDIPHLLAPVVTDPKKASRTLKEWVVREMDRRYKTFYAAGVRNIDAFNAKAARMPKGLEALPYIVIIVDELADLMMVAAAEVETTICRIAQMARATGIHLVIATQRPSVDVITGLIKANIPSRISFAVATQVDSRVILDMSGAEKLLGKGDMLYHPIGSMKPFRLQGAFVSDNEVEKITEFIKKQAQPQYSQEIIDIEYGSETSAGTREGGRDDLFAEAAKIIIQGGQASTSHLQRRLRIGYNRAARLMDEMETAGIVSALENDNKPRRIIATGETLKSLGIK